MYNNIINAKLTVKKISLLKYVITIVAINDNNIAKIFISFPIENF